MDTTTLLQNTVIFRIDMSLWTGKAKLSRADLPDNANIPPEDLAILGQKRLINPDTLKPFFALKTKTIRLMDRYGVKFLSGWLVHKSHVDELDADLCAIRDDYYQHKQEFLAEYHSNVTEWIAQHPEWQAMLATVVPSDAQMAKKFDMYWQVYAVQPVETEGSSMNSEVAHIVSDDVKKMTDELRCIYEDTFANRATPITSRTLGALRDFADKCANLVGIYPSASYMYDAVTNLVASAALPMDPASVQYQQFKQILHFMSDADNMSQCIAEWMDRGADGNVEDVVQMADFNAVPVQEEPAAETFTATVSMTDEPQTVVATSDSQRTLSDLMDDLF